MSYNILIVDDSDVIRTMIGKTLTLADVPVDSIHEAGNGEEALTLLRQTPIDLVLADLNMPVMDGMEMLSRMRGDALLQGIPVVVVSSAGDAPRIDELKAKGISAYVRKPFTPELIRDVIEEVVAETACTSDARYSAVEVFGAVLERFALVFYEEGDQEWPQPRDLVLAARITFRSRARGVLRLLVPQRLASHMAENILGLAPGDETAAAKAEDAVKELLNITCGHVVSSILGEEARLELGPPHVEIADAELQREIARQPGARCLVVEGTPVLIHLALKGRP